MTSAASRMAGLDPAFNRTADSLPYRLSTTLPVNVRLKRWHTERGEAIQLPMIESYEQSALVRRYNLHDQV